MSLSEKDRWLVRSSLLVAAEHYDELSLRCDQPTVQQECFQQQAAEARRIADAIEEADDHLGRTARVVFSTIRKRERSALECRRKCDSLRRPDTDRNEHEMQVDGLRLARRRELGLTLSSCSSA